MKCPKCGSTLRREFDLRISRCWCGYQVTDEELCNSGQICMPGKRGIISQDILLPNGQTARQQREDLLGNLAKRNPDLFGLLMDYARTTHRGSVAERLNAPHC